MRDTDAVLNAAILDAVVHNDHENRVDPATTTAIKNAVHLDNPVVAPVTATALTWVGVAYAVAAVVLELLVNVLTIVDVPEDLARFGLVPAALAIIRIVDRMVRFKVQQGVS